MYHKMEPGFVFQPHLNNFNVEAFNNQTFNQDGNESSKLKTKYYNPLSLIFQHLPIKEKVKNLEVNRMRNGYNTDTLASADTQVIVEIGVRVTEIYEGVINYENFKKPTLREVIEKLFALRQKYKHDGNHLMQG